MGALPSRESNEDPSSVFFANCGSHIVFHIPMTDHYFPSPNSLAFRQLFRARNHQSALYCFDMKDLSPVMPETVAEAFRAAQDEDWGAEVDEVDPSLHYYDEEICEKILERGRNLDPARRGAGVAAGCSPRVGRHFRPSIEDRDELYRVLVTEPMKGTLVETDSEMCTLFEEEQRWRAGLSHLSERHQRQGCRTSKRSSLSGGHDAANGTEDDGVVPATDARAEARQDGSDAAKSGRREGVEAAVAGSPSVGQSATSSASLLPPPPAKFLYPLSRAIALRMTTEEEEEMRAEYCRKHHIPYIAPAFHDVRPSGVGAAPRAPLPVVERRHYHFEDDPKYRDGRVHLVEEHGVLYHFAYFVRHQCQAAASSHGSRRAEAAGSAMLSSGVSDGTTQNSQRPIVHERCLHDVVYCEKPLTSSAASADGEPEVEPPVRYSWCARCGERVTQWLNHTRLRRLMSTRLPRRAARAQRADEDADSPMENNDADEVVSNTECVDEEGEEEFIINVTPVRVVGLDGLLPSRCRGTRWLRGYEQSEVAEDAHIEQMKRKPPVMRLCRFIEGSVGDKIVNRAALVTLLSYRPMCRQAGLSDALTRPIWSTCVLSNIPYLQMVRETFFRAKAAVAEVDDGDLLLRNWLDVVDRENNFYNFINANLYMARNFTPPERSVRQHEQTGDVVGTGTATSQWTTTGACGDGESGSVGITHAESCSAPSAIRPLCDGTVSTTCAAADSYPLAPPTAALQRSDGGAPAVVEARETAADNGLTTGAAAQGVGILGRGGERGDLNVVEGDGADRRSHHLTRALDEVTIGRPEGHGPCDQEDEDKGEDEERGESGTIDSVGESGTVFEAAVGLGSGKKKRHATNVAQRSALCSASPFPPPLPTAQRAADGAAASASPPAEATESARGNTWGTPVLASVMGGISVVVESGFGGLPHRSGGNEESGDVSGENLTKASTSSSRQMPNSAAVTLTVSALDDDDEDDDVDPRVGGKEHRCPRAAVAESAAASRSMPHESIDTTAAEAIRARQQPQRPAVPQRPNFQRFSSRLEPHAPLSLFTFFDYDASTKEAVKRTVTQLTAAAADGVAADKKHVGCRDEDGVSHIATPNVDVADSTTLWPSYIQRDILRENEQRQEEPKATRRRSHALYECGMLATTRGRCFLFLLREDCVRALLYYCSAAASPIFIGAYIEPVDTTSVSYGGTVRLRRPSTVSIPLDDDDEGDGHRTASARNGDGRRVVIEQVEDMEVMAGYFKTKGLITCFSVSDVDNVASGPSAAHRLRKMILPPDSTCSSSAPHFSSNVGLPGEADSLAARQARERAQCGYVFTYAADEFCDGDLVVFNFDERRWEHYEHVQLRRRFAARAAAAEAAAVAETRGASTVPAETAEQITTGRVAVGADGSLSSANFIGDPSMSARLLCVGLDELLLSWTKWIVDNRFYEDRTDVGWLSLPDGSPIQVGGRYFLWSFRHNRQRYFYGVIPKFAKGRLRRQKLMERNRSKKKGAEAPGQEAQNLAAISTATSAGARPSSSTSLASSAPSSPALVTAAAAAASSSPAKVGGECTSWERKSLEAPSEEQPRRRGEGTGAGSLHADPAQDGAAASSPPHPGLGVLPCAGTSTTPSQHLPQEFPTRYATVPDISTSIARRSHPAPAHQLQQQSSHHLQPQQPASPASAPVLQWSFTSIPASPFSAAPATARFEAQQDSSASFLHSFGDLTSAQASRSVVRPTPGSTTATAARGAPSGLFSKRATQQPGGSGSPAMRSPGQRIVLGAGPDYYYRHGGNTCIQAGKRQENEYYPPLPANTPFHPVTAVTQLVPLPHPQTERGGIPAIFRFWGPVRLPAPCTPAAAHLPSSTGGAAVTVSAPSTPSDAVGGSGMAGVSKLRVLHHSTNASPLVAPSVPPGVAPFCTAAAAPASAGNLTVRVRRRTGVGNTAITAGINTGSGAGAASLPPPSLGASLTALAPAGPVVDFAAATTTTHSPPVSSSAPITSWFAAPALLLVGDRGQRRLSPTSRLPTNLINEGSKTKGRSVLRVDADNYVQREAFRWNPYASTKWVQNSSSGGKDQ
ncbi:hypothetical protein LSCM1_07202 [Leishmania martiniquensis]|uniref:Uncharacterized protein n=1 Tax=Leishmania martiniquensis TaxID=1580590 RepID=A0A836HKH7_9TRYP|nr:hypothetical protein LSCM1_07202 [Leishmania martiniquensis]